MKASKDEFDTSILGENVYKLILSGTTTEADIEDVVKKIRKGIIFGFTPLLSQNIHVLERLKFHLVSIRNTYKLVGVHCSTDQLPRDYSIASFASSDTISDSDIFDLAQNIYFFSRYYKDTGISRDKSMKIYIYWIKNSLYKGYAERCFLAWYKDKPIGICTVKIKGSEGYVDLLGILPGYQGKKIGKQLLKKGIQYLQSRKVDSIIVVTEGENIKANIFYQKNNFIIHSVDLVYHKHM